MPRRTTSAVVALVLLTAGCGQQSTPRAAVASYLKQVNKVETALSRPLRTVTNTGNQFAEDLRAGGPLTSLLTMSHESALLAAWAQIRALGARLAALKAPGSAVHLRSLLLEIVGGQAQLTHEVAELVGFLPRYGSALRPLTPAAQRLESALARTSELSPRTAAGLYASKAAALRRFEASVDAVLAQLRQLHPPAVSKPDYDSQVAALKGMGSSAGQLANAVADGSQNNIQELLLQFDHAATSNQTIAAQKARIAAIRAYADQNARLANLTRAAEAERLRLADTLQLNSS